MRKYIKNKLYNLHIQSKSPWLRKSRQSWPFILEWAFCKFQNFCKDLYPRIYDRKKFKQQKNWLKNNKFKDRNIFRIFKKHKPEDWSEIEFVPKKESKLEAKRKRIIEEANKNGDKVENLNGLLLVFKNK